ncbi:MAG: hypothetical protein F4X09_10350 [Gammaproteobacteria bacterium]|nr:hypothetical protein [Gammaproteobacteria bacterium]
MTQIPGGTTAHRNPYGRPGWCAERTSEEVLAEMEAARLPAGPVLSPQEVLEDPHIAARGIFQATEYPGLNGSAPLMKTPVELSETPGEIRERPPTLGEHTHRIMRELGYGDEDIDALRAKRVI